MCSKNPSKKTQATAQVSKKTELFNEHLNQNVQLEERATVENLCSKHLTIANH